MDKLNQILEACKAAIEVDPAISNLSVEVGPSPESYSASALGKGKNKVYIYDDAGIAPAEEYETLAEQAWAFSVGFEVVEQRPNNIAPQVVKRLKDGQRLGGLAIVIEVVNVTQPIRIDPQRSLQVTVIETLIIFRGDPA